MKTDLLIVGAGPTGIGAAVRAQELGLDWHLVESGPGPGGMAGSVTDEHGFTWDLGGHVLHSHFASFDKAIANSGIELIYPTRNGWAQVDGVLKRTPIQQHLEPHELPTDTNPDADAENLEHYYRNQFGARLAETFFIPFQEKMWATPCTEIAHDWTSLRNGSAERNVPQLGGVPSIEHIVFPYPKGGTGALWDAIAAGLDAERLHFNTALTGLVATERRAQLSDGTEVTYGSMVSSMNLPLMLELAGLPAQPSLRANEVLVIGLGFEGTPPLPLADKSWIYNADPTVPWHRATMLSNYDPDNAGAGRWNILFEIGRSAYRPVLDADALGGVWTSMLGFGARIEQAVSTWTKALPMGYPVPTLERDEILRDVDGELMALGIRSRGRFGGWRYESCNQDYSFAQGVEAVDAFLTGAPEDVYWHADRF